MTALCGGGTSGRKSGIPDQILISGSGIAALLALFGQPELSAIVEIALAGTNLVTDVFCGNDPPDDPGLTQTDIDNAQNFGDLSVQVPAAEKLAQWFLSQYWHTLCQCTSGSTPAPAAPSNPGPIGTNTGLPSASPAQCFQYNGTLTVDSGGTGTIIQDYTASVFPPVGPTSTRVYSVNSHTYTLLPVPPGITSTTWQGLYPTPQATDTHTALNITWWPATGQPSLHAALATAASNTATIGTSVPVPSGAAFWSLTGEETGGPTRPFNFQLAFSAQCGGPGFAQPCCPPDTSMDLRLRQIQELLTEIYSSLPTPLVAYAELSTHSGLSGGGTVGIDAMAIAIKVVLTSVPAYIGSGPGEPPRLYHVGALSFTTVEGTYSGQVIEYQTQVFSVPPLGYTVSYDLEPNVVATIVELGRGS